MDIKYALKRGIQNPLFLVLKTSGLRPVKQTSLKAVLLKDKEGNVTIFDQGTGYDIMSDVNAFILDFEPDGIITYSVDYFLVKWFDKFQFRYNDLVLDILSVEFFKHCRYTVPEDVLTVQQIRECINKEIKGEKTGYTLESVIKRHLPTKCETQEQKLKSLFLLWRLIYAPEN